MGRLTRKFVKLSLIVQINGKMLTASNKNIVGATKIQAMVRSDKPRMRLAILSGVFAAAVSMGEIVMVSVLAGELRRTKKNFKKALQTIKY